MSWFLAAGLDGVNSARNVKEHDSLLIAQCEIRLCEEEEEVYSEPAALLT